MARSDYSFSLQEVELAHILHGRDTVGGNKPIGLVLAALASDYPGLC